MDLISMPEELIYAKYILSPEHAARITHGLARELKIANFKSIIEKILIAKYFHILFEFIRSRIFI